MYQIYIYDENGEVVGQTATTEERVALAAKVDARFVAGIKDGWEYRCNGFEDVDDNVAQTP